MLDTNALSAFFDEDERLLGVLAGFRVVHVPVIVLGEYRFGLANSRKRRVLLPRLDAMEADCVVLEVDAITARKYAEIRDELRRAGTPIPENDLWIAALARQHALAVVSGDAHFDQVSGIRRKTW